MNQEKTFLIGPLPEGVRRDLKPFAIAENAFESLRNCFQYLGRIIRRWGYKKLGVLPSGAAVTGLRTKEGFGIGLQSLVAFDKTTAYQYSAGTFSTLPSVMPVTWNGQDYNLFYTTNYANAFWATNNVPGLNGASIANITQAITPTVTTDANHGFTTGQTVAFINVSGMTQINGLTSVITVTGATTFTITINTTTFSAYSGSNGFALNSYVQTTGQDGIRYYGVLNGGTGWANYNPPIDTQNALAGCLLIFPYRGYLVFLNTWEGNELNVDNYPNRARWTQIGTPYYSLPVPQSPNIYSVDPLAVRDDIFGRGGAQDAPTNEAIVSAGFIRDVIIVKFEKSTWRLRFVNDADNPFVWERINVELGSDCTFGTVIFDKGMMDISQRGVNISDGNDTERFDQKIPEEVFNIRQTNQGYERVYGIRTFRSRLIYWAFGSSDAPNGTYNNRVLVFNYESSAWSFFDDSFTCFGYYYPTGTGYTWADLTDPWGSYTNLSWNSGISQAGYENIIAGNQQGYVLILEQTAGNNDPSLAISNLAGSTVTSNNHNLADETWITITGVTGTTSMDGVSLNGRNFKIADPTINANTFTLREFKPINGGNASGTSYIYTVSYQTILKGSCRINIGALLFTDPNGDGVLVEASNLGSGTINYSSGLISLSFNPAIVSTAVYIRVVSLDPTQGLSNVSFTGAYTGGGEIAIRSNFSIQSKIFNFFKVNERARLNSIDFYVNSTAKGQFTCNVWADSSDDPVNAPLSNNPQSNVVLTSTAPNQIGLGEQTLYRMYSPAQGQTLQFEFTLSDAQMAVNTIYESDMQLIAFMVNMRAAGRLV